MAGVVFTPGMRDGWSSGGDAFRRVLAAAHERSSEAGDHAALEVAQEVGGLEPTGPTMVHALIAAAEDLAAQAKTPQDVAHYQELREMLAPYAI
ncbi:hypothetical protein OJ997_36105 [Solirubrobacter phytolaccae]|uniref:Uncharacterized protein n=1 Tax=Solirubrobacter phytolaccae TaxID=1404360 RepID=A0A9X3NIB3_9ACTN|nr:hypothetical protein [Solirubrobacter phytolaccae]MDA0185784.1 hypothetical protein [Solirubrobacter phytolaccae]